MKALCVVLLFYVFSPQMEIPKVKNVVEKETLIKTLQRGLMILVHHKETPESPQFISAGALINAPAEKVWAVITDYEHYNDFMPQTKKVRIKEKRGNVWDVEYNLYFKFTVIKMGVHYVLETHLMPPYDIWWVTKEGEDNDIKQAMGRWEIIPLDKSKTAAFYTIYSDLKSMGRLVRFFLKHQPQIELAIPVSTGALVVNAIKKRAEESTFPLGGEKEKKKKDFSF